MKHHLVTVVDRARQGLPHAFKRARSGGSAGSGLERETETFHLPPELWLHIFTYLITYSSSTTSTCQTDSIRAATLTCHAFRSLAQPLLFAKISTHPPPPRNGYGIIGLGQNPSGPRYRRRTVQRMEFFSSVAIAPAVREVTIDPPEDHSDVEEIDTIFESLAKFPNLTTLVLRSIRLSLRRLSLLHQLRLTTVTLDSCPSDITAFASSALRPLSLSTVVLKYPTSDTPDESLPPLFAVFLSPKYLHRLSSNTTQVLPPLAQSPRAFLRLQHLEVSVFGLTSPSFVTAMSQCPNLERLNLQTDHVSAPNIDVQFHGHPLSNIPRTGVPGALPANVIPLLKLYRGPRNFAGLFARSGGCLNAVELSGPIKAHRLARTLRLLPKTLESLSFRVDGDVPKTLLKTIGTQFPALRSLSMTDPLLSGAALDSLLAPCRDSPLSSLRIIRLRVEGKDRYNLWVPPVEQAGDVVDVFGKVRPALQAVYPGLICVKLVYGLENACLVWRGRGGKHKELVLVTPID
ncbi:hypothetical protein MIND_01159100 [Mycena indigotica]|uniref:F-box domain-containing protein n=1 Tax=Mycena indigotica TaxID=2126181 RepID=A0A8H6S554_9AGAR|nr:uncharacterized protein MIND_01159100 [Mycena indigotica]KAF7292612.1 hypothetical protein MIND_01159100 [Mycena indigotica]